MDKAHGGAIKVFLAEDCAPLRARLADMLLAVDGVSIAGEAATPAAAIEGILQTRPDFVILDIHLAGGSGIGVLREIRNIAPCIVFIVLTNVPAPQYRKVYMQAGASYFLDKATEFTTVVEIIAACAARVDAAMHR